MGGAAFRCVGLVLLVGTARAHAQPAPDAGAATDPVSDPASQPPAPTVPPMPAPTAAPPVSAAPPGAATSQATAEPDPYPLAITDRPILLPDGITELRVSEQFRTSIETKTDAMGTMTRSRSGFFDHPTTDLSVAHAFAGFEAGIGLGQLLYGWIGIDTKTIPRRFGIDASWTGPQLDGRYRYIETIGVSHKLVVQHERFAVFANADIFLAEVNQNDVTNTIVKGTITGVEATVTNEVQLTRRLGLYVRAYAGAPITQSARYGAHAAVSASTSLLLAFRRWDIIASGSLGDLTRDIATTVGLAVAKRWGL